ncbi:hypothetical protein WN48_09163 [Eufriesea mexicana]|nr:hypothetical protein WN48_09163 [Eufriesea mexicana]
MFKENEVIVHKNQEEIFVGKMYNNGLYTSREEQEAGREAQKIGESMYREDERVVHENCVFANAWELTQKEEKEIDNLKTELIAKEAREKQIKMNV